MENAIRHATLDSYQEIQIQVTITENEYIHIEIQDNGVGIEPVKIANLLNEEQDGYQGGIGLRNVSRRLGPLWHSLWIFRLPGSGHQS